jgi:probable selenium-dependent hydroxylase accessory protein YqeC
LYSEQFAFDLPVRVNFVGGGGKTLLILRLMEEYSCRFPVIYTTTTRIHPPHPSNGLVIIACDDSKLLRCIVEKTVLGSTALARKIVVTRNSTSPRLLAGVAPDFGETLDKAVFPIIFNEADGAKSMSLKMPRDGEPVLMQGANYIVPVIGLDCLMQPLGPETLFRWELASVRYSLQEGQLLTPELAAALLLHPQGVCRDWTRGMRVIPFINKVDSVSQEPLARELAKALLHNRNFPVQRVVWGSLFQDRADSICAVVS